jgi:glycosyltransferase involved in cell wall biosynthesis
MQAKQRIVYFLSHPIQYISPLLRELAKKTDLIVYYYSDASVRGGHDKDFGIDVQWDVDLLNGYEYKFLKNYSRRKSVNNNLFDVFNPDVYHVLINEKNAIFILNGWSYSTDLMIVFFSKCMGRKLWLRAENPLNQELKKSRKTLFLKKIFLKNILFRLISKALYIGTESRKFFEYYGLPLGKLVFTPYAVDNDFFTLQSERLQGREIDTRNRLLLSPQRKIILFIGKYITKKNPLDLLKAFRMLEKHNYLLVMVGEGVLRPEMEKYIAENHLDHVVLTGFINQSVISDYYSIADVFVMCSGIGETWGLAVNEAMNFGKPVIVSDISGSSGDLIKQGRNGFIFPAGDINKMAEYIHTILEDDALRSTAAHYSREIIKEYSINHIVENICEEISTNQIPD